MPPASKTFRRLKSGQRFTVGSTNPEPVCQRKTESDLADVKKTKFDKRNVRMCLLLCTAGVKMSGISLSTLTSDRRAMSSILVIH